jgi:chromosome segregation ATPase
MNTMDVLDTSASTHNASNRIKRILLEQMAEALEDEAAGLSLRAAGFGEEEYLLNRELETHRTEINRLQLRMEAVRAERQKVLNKIETLRGEARELREGVIDCEEELALACIECSRADN